MSVVAKSFSWSTAMPARHRVQAGLMVFLVLHAVPAPAADAPVWLRDIDAGKAEAKATNKDLFLLFTGVGWCKPCMDFDAKVLKQSAFLNEVRKTYTLVELDHTFGETPAEKARQAKFATWEKEYLVNAFPTVVLADAAGTPYAVMTGGEDEVPLMLKWVAKARVVREHRDREFAAAAQGAERAAALHRGIQAIAGQLGTFEERRDDPVLSYYQGQVAEIARLDTGGTIRKVYDDRRVERDRSVAAQAVFDRLRKFDEDKDYRGAIAFLDAALKTETNRGRQLKLERSRVAFLDRDQQYDDVLRSVRKILGRNDLTGDEKYELMFHETATLMRLGRVEEGIAVFDRCIADADTPEKRLRRLDWKAELIPVETHRNLKMAAWRVVRTEAPQGSDKWQNATFFLADDARKAGRPREALTLYHEIQAVGPFAICMIRIAECHLDLGEASQAREWIERAEAEAAKLKVSSRQGDQQTAGRIEEFIKKVRERLKAQ
jgi:tetratricopeptide (TPR) repeat protein